MTLTNTAVVVPCYRCADTLPRAVHSILDGAPSDLQLILVDDGSGDDTLSVCRALAAQDKRIRVLQRPNGGASAARNTGLDAVPNVDWLMFADADDELFPGLWQELNTADVPPACGMVLFGFRADSGLTSVGQMPVGRFADLPALGTAFSSLLFELGVLSSPCMKFYRRRDIGTLRFNEALKINEDVLFNLQFLQKNSSTYFLQGCYYCQHDVRQGSLSRRLRGDLLQAEAVTRPELERLLRQHGIDPTPYAKTGRLHACLNQYGLLTGCRGTMPFAERRALFAEILSDPDARAALRTRLQNDPHRLLSLPYRLGLACRLPGFLAAYTMAKQRFL